MKLISATRLRCKLRKIGETELNSSIDIDPILKCIHRGDKKESKSASLL